MQCADSSAAIVTQTCRVNASAMHTLNMLMTMMRITVSRTMLTISACEISCKSCQSTLAPLGDNCSDAAVGPTPCKMDMWLCNGLSHWLH
eukprot:5682637-Amphidinium_carterae.1